MGARELLELTPCDLYSFIRGRTLWLVGDSIQQVQPLHFVVPRHPMHDTRCKCPQLSAWQWAFALQCALVVLLFGY